jgi:hypothetical protein
MAKHKRVFILAIGLIGAVVAGLMLHLRYKPQPGSTMSQSNSPNIIARTRVWLGTRFEEASTYTDVEFVNRTTSLWKVKRVIYSCCGNTEKYYRWTPDVVPPGGTLHVQARLDLSGHIEKVVEKPIRQTFWIEVETDGHPARGFLVADIEGVQKNCLPDAPIYLNLRPSNEIFYRFHPHLNLRSVRIKSTVPSLTASVDSSRRALRLRCDHISNICSGKIMLYQKDKLLRTIHVEVSPSNRLWVTPRFLGFGILSRGRVATKELKVIFDNPNKMGNRVQLLTSSVPAGEFRLVSAKQESTSVLLLIEFLPRNVGRYYGTLRLKVLDTILDIPWSCEVVSEAQGLQSAQTSLYKAPVKK